MKKIRLGFDANLGLPSDFSEKVCCELTSHSLVDPLITEFNNRQLDCIFIPVGTLPYLQNYQVIAQAIFSETNQTVLKSNFVSAESIEIDNLTQYTLGRVNRYCTTSYWAPLISLMKYLPKKSELNFHDTHGFVELLRATATRLVDAGMVWDIIMHRNNQLADQVHLLFEDSQLPSPVIISHKDSPYTSDTIPSFESEDKKAYYSGFVKPDETAINLFLEKIQTAVEFYNLSLDPTVAK